MGVKQCDPLSPNLFHGILEGIFRTMRWEAKELGSSVSGLTIFQFYFVHKPNVFSHMCCAQRMCSGIAKGFYGQNPPEIYTTFQLEKEEKNSQSSSVFKI